MSAEYAQGGIVRGAPVTVTFVPELRPLGGGDLAKVYADECFISRDGLCVRSDSWHRSAPIPDAHAWICPTHD